MGWVLISVLGLKTVEQLIHMPSDCLLAVDLGRLQHSQLPAAAVLPVAGSLSLQHKLGISS